MPMDLLGSGPKNTDHLPVSSGDQPYLAADVIFPMRPDKPIVHSVAVRVSGPGDSSRLPSRGGFFEQNWFCISQGTRVAVETSTGI